MARTRRVIKKNLIRTLDAEATNSPPSNQPQPPGGEATLEKNDSPARGTNPPPSNQPKPPASEASPEKNDFPARGGLKIPPRPDLRNDPVPTSDPPAQNAPGTISKEGDFPSSESSLCATKSCTFQGTVYQFYYMAQKNTNKDRFYCLDCINKFRAKSRARKKRSASKSK